MDSKNAALFLSGKMPPKYKKINRLEFMEELERSFLISLEKINFYRKQSGEREETFYYMVLDLFYNKSKKEALIEYKFKEFVETLGIETFIS